MRRYRTHGGRRFRVRLALSVIRGISMLPSPSRVVELLGVQAASFACKSPCDRHRLTLTSRALRGAI